MRMKASTARELRYMGWKSSLHHAVIGCLIDVQRLMTQVIAMPASTAGVEIHPKEV